MTFTQNINWSFQKWLFPFWKLPLTKNVIPEVVVAIFATTTQHGALAGKHEG